MKRLLLIFPPFLLSISFVFAQSIGIGTDSPHPLAQLDISSNSKGLLIPRLTQTEVNSLVTPPHGLIVFNTSSNSFQFFNGVAWNNMAHSGIIVGQSNRIAKFTGPWGMSSGLMLDNGSGISINGANPDASALLDMTSTNKGVLVPRMTSGERSAIAGPAKGLLVFDNTTSTFWYHNGTAWMELGAGGGGGGGFWTQLGNTIYNNNSGNVGIGTTTPTHKLSVEGNAVISGLGLGITTPDLSNFKLDINGSARTRIDQYVNRDLWVDRNLDVDGTSNLLGNILAGGGLSVADNVTVDGGKGIVRSANSAQRVVAFPSGTVGFTNVPAGFTTDVEFALPNVFAATPVISVGNISSASGAFGLFMMTVHDIDIVAHRFKVRFHCPAGYSGNATFTVSFIAIGTAL